jgi:hypothetical protein
MPDRPGSKIRSAKAGKAGPAGISARALTDRRQGHRRRRPDFLRRGSKSGGAQKGQVLDLFDFYISYHTFSGMYVARATFLKFFLFFLNARKSAHRNAPMGFCARGPARPEGNGKKWACAVKFWILRLCKRKKA